MAESSMVRLVRQKKELISYIKRFHAWREALDFANITSRKGDAFRVVDERRKEVDEQRKIIEPYLAE